jgi:hypothetical protein
MYQKAYLLSIMTVSIMALGIMALSILTLSIISLRIKNGLLLLQLNVVMLSVIMLNVAAPMIVDRFFYFKPTFLKGLDKLMKTLFWMLQIDFLD